MSPSPQNKLRRPPRSSTAKAGCRIGGHARVEREGGRAWSALPSARRPCCCLVRLLATPDRFGIFFAVGDRPPMRAVIADIGCPDVGPSHTGASLVEHFAVQKRRLDL